MNISPVYIQKHLGNRVIDQYGVHYDYFAGTSYLGFNTDKRHRAYVLQGFDKIGQSFGVSRYGNVKTTLIDELEAALSELLSVPKVVSLSSGFLACQICINTILPEYDQIFVSPKAHPAILPHGYSNFKGSFDEWFAFLKQQDTTKTTLIISDALNATLGQSIPFEQIPKQFDNERTTLLIDESHSLGILGKNGAGIYHSIKSHFRALSILCTASIHKAWGTPGGILYGELDRHSELTSHSAFSGGSPILPAYAYAFLNYVINNLSTRNKQLKTNIEYFKQLLDQHNLSSSFFSNTDLPTFALKATQDDLYNQLLSHAILPSCFKYPLSSSPSFVRFVLNSGHKEPQLKKINSFLVNNTLNLY